jgi:hypothetical protein
MAGSISSPPMKPYSVPTALLKRRLGARVAVTDAARCIRLAPRALVRFTFPNHDSAAGL